MRRRRKTSSAREADAAGGEVIRRSGTRCRSRPRRSSRPEARAWSSSSRRRARLITAPSGYWCEGVTKISRGGVPLRGQPAPGPRRPPRAVQRPHARGVHLQHLVKAPVAGLLDPHRVARVDQHAQRHVDGLVHAFGHEDLVGLAAHRARHAQVFGDGRAQRGVAAAGARRSAVRAPAPATAGERMRLNCGAETASRRARPA
jgi:hypothetical protein